MNEPKPAELNAQPAVMRATIHITRKDTGKVETYEIVGTVPPGSVPADVVQPKEAE